MVRDTDILEEVAQLEIVQHHSLELVSLIMVRSFAFIARLQSIGYGRRNAHALLVACCDGPIFRRQCGWLDIFTTDCVEL
jgi:hypothetical protein